MIEIFRNQVYISTVSALRSAERDKTPKHSGIIQECHVYLQD